MKTLEQFKKEINNAKTIAELRNISYEALKQDSNVTIMDMAMSIGSKPKGLYNKVCNLCIHKEIELEEKGVKE